MYNVFMIIQLLINALAFYITAYIIPGMVISGWQTLLVVSIIWGILTLLLKPVLIILTLPINILTLGLFTFVINAILLLITSSLVPGFEIAGFVTALLAAFVLTIVNGFLSKLK
jgi:putative membrane protein